MVKPRVTLVKAMVKPRVTLVKAMVKPRVTLEKAMVKPRVTLVKVPQWGAADAEIKVPSGENTELKRSPSKAWSRSVYSHTCYAYCQGFLSCLFLHFRSIHLHFSETSPDFSLCWLWLTHGSCVGPQNKIGRPAGCRFPC